MKKIECPLAEAVLDYAEKGRMAFHTPGHKRGLGANALLRNFFTDTGLRADVSLADGLDDLSAPKGCIKEAQELAASLWGADAALFSVNGTTGAVHAMLMGCLCPGDAVLAARNLHRSVLGAFVLMGLRPIFLPTEIDDELGIAMGLMAETVKKGIAAHPEAKALVMTSPTYYGVASDLRQIADIVHSAGKLLLVDEAHGAHLGFSDALPPSAMEAGADMASVSTHKLLGAMTGASMLLVKSERVDEAKVAKAMSILTTTSPNEIMLASLDIARLQMEESGHELWKRALSLAGELREKINNIPGLFSFGRERTKTPGAYALDETKVTVTVEGLGLTGMEAFRILQSYGIEGEMADAKNVLFLITYADTEKETEALLQALSRLAKEERRPQKVVPQLKLPTIPPQKISPREAFFAKKENISLENAEGKISAEEILCYPPGIPLIYPGEVLTAEIIGYVKKCKTLGLKVMGPRDLSLKKIGVIA